MAYFLYAPFVLHTIVEATAGYSFVFRPHLQLQPLPTAARLILECYGGLLFFSALMSAIFCARDFDGSSRLAAAAFAFWHLWPSRRAVIRMQQGVNVHGRLGATLGGPELHMWVHGVLFIGFGLAATFG
jgi:hypothetical protein